MNYEFFDMYTSLTTHSNSSFYNYKYPPCTYTYPIIVRRVELIYVEMILQLKHKAWLKYLLGDYIVGSDVRTCIYKRDCELKIM